MDFVCNPFSFSSNAAVFGRLFHGGDNDKNEHGRARASVHVPLGKDFIKRLNS